MNNVHRINTAPSFEPRPADRIRALKAFRFIRREWMHAGDVSDLWALQPVVIVTIRAPPATIRERNTFFRVDSSGLIGPESRVQYELRSPGCFPARGRTHAFDR